MFSGRWDFDTQEEYSDYMSTKEALPKAAFQYGVKMQDGRKTRKHKTEKNEKAELDREWQKIQVRYLFVFVICTLNHTNVILINTFFV